MRDALIYGVAIVLAGLAIGLGISRGARELALRGERYTIAAVGNRLAVVDVRSGIVQTFQRKLLALEQARIVQHPQAGNLDGGTVGRRIAQT